MNMTYLDWAATSMPDRDIAEAVYEATLSVCGNPSSQHREGKQAAKFLHQARETCSSALHIEPEQVIFTSGATEANNAVLFSLMERGKKSSLITTGIEHPSIYEPAKKLKRMGLDVRVINADSSGFVDPADIADSIDSHTAIISVIHVQNETGAIQPIKEIAQLIRAKEKQFGHRIHFHTDMVQSLGKIDIDLAELDVDSASFSGHKFCGPKGTGILYLKHPQEMLYSGGEQEFGMRPGTENVPAIHGLSKAVQKYVTRTDERHEKAARAKRTLLRRLSETGFCSFIESQRDNNYSPFITTLFIPPVPGEVIVRVMSDRGFAISTGSACSKNRQKRTRTLTNMNIPREKAFSAIRISIGYTTTEEHVDGLVEALKAEIPILKKVAG